MVSGNQKISRILSKPNPKYYGFGVWKPHATTVEAIAQAYSRIYPFLILTMHDSIVWESPENPVKRGCQKAHFHECLSYWIKKKLVDVQSELCYEGAQDED